MRFRLYAVAAVAAMIAAFGLGSGEVMARGGGGGGGGGGHSVSVASRGAVAVRAAGVRTASGRVVVARVASARNAARPITLTRTRLNSVAAIRAGGPRTIVVTHTVVRDRCAHLLSRAGPPASGSHYLWMSRYNSCRGQ